MKMGTFRFVFTKKKLFKLKKEKKGCAGFLCLFFIYHSMHIIPRHPKSPISEKKTFFFSKNETKSPRFHFFHA